MFCATFRQRFRYVLISCVAVQFWLLPICERRVDAREPAANKFFLHDGDRVVFYGDSITEQGHYTTAVETFVATRFPLLKVSFVNSGWGGDRTWGGEGGSVQERLQRDVIAHRPTVVTIMLGMNDPYYMGYDEKILRAFSDGLEVIVNVLQKNLPDVRITLLGTSPYDNVSPGAKPKWEETIDGGYNTVVRRFSQVAKEVADRHKLLFVDMNEPLVRLLKRAHETNRDLAGRLIPDRIHPGPAAGLAMAAELLKAWNAPEIVSAVQIDASTGEGVWTTGAAVTDVVRCGGMRWTQRDMALPFPIDENDELIKLVLKCSPQLNSLNRQLLRITKLPKQKMTLLINGQSIGVFGNGVEQRHQFDIARDANGQASNGSRKVC